SFADYSPLSAPHPFPTRRSSDLRIATKHRVASWLLDSPTNVYTNVNHFVDQCGDPEVSELRCPHKTRTPSYNPKLVQLRFLVQAILLALIRQNLLEYRCS